jgi:hypothetical protein
VTASFFASKCLAKTFEACSGARWIHCDHEVPVGLRFGSQAFAGQQGVVAWLNGEKLYAGSITNEPNRKAVRKSAVPAGLAQAAAAPWDCGSVALSSKQTSTAKW